MQDLDMDVINQHHPDLMDKYKIEKEKEKAAKEKQDEILGDEKLDSKVYSTDEELLLKED